MKKFIRSWRETLRYQSDTTASYGIVFYSEGDSYGPYLRPVIDELAGVYDDIVYYLTSDEADRLLLDPPQHVRGFYVGKGTARTHALNNLRADVLAMTMPDLNSFHIKRSPKVRNYAYLHHSLVSTHMIYRTAAFDHFDSILCVGPHHNRETREWEALQGLPEKQLFDHGHPPLDALIDLARTASTPAAHDDKRLNVLLAPSWGPQGLMETRAEEVVSILLDAGHFVRVRPHPRTRQMAGKTLDALAAKFADHPSFDMNEDTTKYQALLDSHVMISDWSGVAMEFAFGLAKPVLFVDVPRKVNNPDYTSLASAPLEVSYREEVGRVIDPGNLSELPDALAALQADADSFPARIEELRRTHFYNIGSSARQGAKILAELAAETKGQA
ncbi:MAG: CDP-glycerol--glycerophosphate glycerophosphotransferase [Pseudomonadota bacterium]